MLKKLHDITVRHEITFFTNKEVNNIGYDDVVISLRRGDKLKFKYIYELYRFTEKVLNYSDKKMFRKKAQFELDENTNPKYSFIKNEKYFITDQLALDLLIKVKDDPFVYLIHHHVGIEDVEYSKQARTLGPIIRHLADIGFTSVFNKVYDGTTYRPDLIVAGLRLIIECDENGHRNYSGERERELALNAYNFIRYNPDKPNFDLNDVIKEINRYVGLKLSGKLFIDEIIEKLRVVLDRHESVLMRLSHVILYIKNPDVLCISADELYKFLGYKRKLDFKKLITKDREYIRKGKEYQIFNREEAYEYLNILDVSKKIKTLLRVDPQEKRDRRGGSGKEIILLSLRGFQKVCIRSTKKEAHKLIDSYIDLYHEIQKIYEQLINDRQDLINNIRDKHINIAYKEKSLDAQHRFIKDIKKCFVETETTNLRVMEAKENIQRSKESEAEFKLELEQEKNDKKIKKLKKQLRQMENDMEFIKENSKKMYKAYKKLI